MGAESSIDLCEVCSGISIQSLQGSGGYLHLQNVWNLRASSRSCASCALLVRAIQRKRMPDTWFHPSFEAALETHGISEDESLPVRRRQSGNNLIVEVEGAFQF